MQRLQNRAARILTRNFDYVNTRGIDLSNTTLFQATAHNTHIQIQIQHASGRIYTVEYVHISVIDNMHSYTIDEL